MRFQEKDDTATSAVKRFWLDLETTTVPLFREYQEIVRQQSQNGHEK